MQSHQFGNHHTVQTHSYDGKIDKAKYIEILNQTQLLSNTDKHKVIDQFQNMIPVISINHKSYTNHIKTTGLVSINKIISSIGTSANYDPTNNLWAEDLLFLIVKKLLVIKKEEFDDLFLNLMIQLSDIIVSGQCPQGRSIRLWQIFQILY